MPTTHPASKILQSRVIETKPVAWKTLQFIQQDDFKELPPISKEKLKKSILSNEFTQPFYVWKEETTDTTYCLDGRHRTLILLELEADGHVIPELLPATYVACSGKKEAAQLVLIYSSMYAKITQEGLAGFISEYDLDFPTLQETIDIPDFDEIDFLDVFFPKDGQDKIIPQSLQERFVVPPFSIFDTRQGYWQNRKKAWHALGFDSQATRQDVELIAKSGQAPAVYELRNKMREALGRDPDWDEIIAEANKRGLHIYSGASVFDPVLTEVCYRWFVPAGGAILDPFAGGSVRGIVAGVLNLPYVGIDLRADQVKANIVQASGLKVKFENVPVWIPGDSNKVLDDDFFDGECFDFIFSCPPYFDLEQYSDDPSDLSNMEFLEFLESYRSIIRKSVSRLKDNRFACFVVGDIRDDKGFYRDFVGDTVQAFRDAGMELYNEIILINVAGSLPVRIGRQFEGYRKVGKMHQNVLVFYKGDPKKIREEFPEIKAGELLDETNEQPNITL